MIALARAVSGLALWAVAFSTVYAIEGAGCALGWDRDGSLRALLIGSWALFLAGHVALAWAVRGGGPALVDRLASGMAIVGLAATAWTLVPVVVGSLCG